MTSDPTPRTGPLWPMRAELLLTDPPGRVLLIGTGTAVSLPGGQVQPGQDPVTTATVCGTAVTGLVRLEAGRLLAVCWSPEPAGPIDLPVEAEQTRVYDHLPLTAQQAAALTADCGLHGGSRLVAPDELPIAAPGAAPRILAALDARTRGGTAGLVHGRPSPAGEPYRGHTEAANEHPASSLAAMGTSRRTT